MKVRLAQLDCVLGDVDINLTRIVETIHAAEGCDLLLFPEMADTGYHMDVIREQAGRADWSRIQEAAREVGVAVACGLSEREDEHIYNSLVVFDAAGEIYHRYRKTHLATVFEEAEVFTPGDAVETFELAGACCGAAICFDLRFPEVFRHYTVKGAQVILLISAWPFPRLEHWNTLLRARAIENQVYVLAVNRTGRDQNTTFCGSSRVIDPYGVIVASAPEDEAVCIDATLDLGLVERVRARLPVLDALRTDLF
jgi:omega-amidase